MIHRKTKNICHKNFLSGKVNTEIFMQILKFNFRSCDANNDYITRLCTKEKME